MATIIQSIKTEIDMTVRLYQHCKDGGRIESVQFWAHNLDRIRTTIFTLWSMGVLTQHGFDTLTRYLWTATRETDAVPKLL